MEMKKTFASICLCLLLSSHAFAASSRDDLQARVDAAKVVLDQIMDAKDRSIPPEHSPPGHLRRRGSRHD